MTTTKSLTQIEVGDVIRVNSADWHRITIIEPPTEAGARLGCYGYARGDDGWAIALYPLITVEVA